MGGRSWRLLRFGLLRFRANLLFAGGDIHLVVGTLLRPRFLLLVGVISLTIRSRDGIVGKRRGAAFDHGVRHACCGTGLPPLAQTRLPYATLASFIVPSSKPAGLL